MTSVLCALEMVALVATIFLFLHLLESQQETHDRQQDAWRDERRELLERIQRPEVVPVRRASNFELPDVERDDSHLVGTISSPAED